MKHAQDRVQSLFGIFDSTPSTVTTRDDVLRAIVVLLHATLEESLRLWKAAVLLNASSDELNKIPLVGARGRNAEKFLLGRLVEFRGRTIDSVIRQSIIESVRQETFNSFADVASVLKMLNLKNEHREIFTRNFPAVLDSIMRRRHQIAHEGDCIFNKDKIKLRKIARKDVDHWSKIVFQVVGLIVIFVGAEKIDKSKATT